MRTPFACIVLAGLACLTAPAGAQETPPSETACHGAPYDAFDFWLGDWDVYAITDDGIGAEPAGRNVITAEESNCLILERWAAASGPTGQSYNFFDPARDEWRQLWVSSGVVIDYAGGLTQDGAMHLEGRIAYRTGRVTDFRGTWTPQHDGTVIQAFQEYDAEDNVWRDWFTGLYVPAGSAPPQGVLP